MKKGVELAFSNILLIVILMIFLIIMGAIIANWGSQSNTVLNRLFDFL